MIHIGLNTSEIALRYYSKYFPTRNYDRKQAARQFDQDSKIEPKKVWVIVQEIMKEQKELLK